jgi:hypothetical protein
MMTMKVSVNRVEGQVVGIKGIKGIKVILRDEMIDVLVFSFRGVESVLFNLMTPKKRKIDLAALL